MTELSPAATAVLTAYNETYESDRHAVAAALRAAADQLREAYTNEEYVDPADDWLDDIATELEAL